MFAILSASVADEEVNPLVRMETEEFLQEGAVNQIVAKAGIPKAEQVEWHAGPNPVANPSTPQPMYLGTETKLKIFSGVVSSEGGPFGVLVSVARATPDDHVAAANVIRRPVSTPEFEEIPRICGRKLPRNSNSTSNSPRTR